MAKGPVGRLINLLRVQTVHINRAYDLGIKNLTDSAVESGLRDMILANPNDPDAVVDQTSMIFDWGIKKIAGSIVDAFTEVGHLEADLLARGLRIPSVSIGFDVTNPRAVATMQNNALQFIREFSEQQRAATRAALVDALERGAGPLDAARAIKNSIGLTEYQLGTVRSYQTSLEASSRDALNRALRDRRFDSTVEAAVEGVKPLKVSQIELMVERYRQLAVAMRAETISRTEALRTINTARQEATLQVMEHAGIPAERVRRTWRATSDNRTRDSHAAMDGQERGLNEPFSTPSGYALMFPGDPNGPIEEIINCRCVVLVGVD